MIKMYMFECRVNLIWGYIQHLRKEEHESDPNRTNSNLGSKQYTSQDMWEAEPRAPAATAAYWTCPRFNNKYEERMQLLCLCSRPLEHTTAQH